MTQNKKNIQENTHGSSEWEEPKNTLEFRDKDLIKNQIFTSTEMFAKDMKVSKRNRNVILLGRPGTGKSRYYFKPNILNADGETIIITDPKGELLRDCGMSLINKGYDIRVLNLVEKWKSDHFNPLLYIKKINRYVSEDSEGEEWIAEDDVMNRKPKKFSRRLRAQKKRGRMENKFWAMMLLENLIPSLKLRIDLLGPRHSDFLAHRHCAL